MKPITVLSLFDGIFCGHVALDRAGIPVRRYFASEIDKYAMAVTRYNYPETIFLGDVENIDSKQFEGKIDLLIGGSPCTNLSIAGNRKGLEGNESRLFWEYVRALKEIKPKYFLLENVGSMSDKDKEIISKEVGCYPIMINSSLLSAQNRKRYYWFNWGNKQYNLFGFPTCDIPQPKDKHILLKDILESGMGYKDKAYCLTTRYSCACIWNSLERKQRTMVAEPVVIDDKAETIKAQYYKSGVANFLRDDAFKATGVFYPVIYQLPHGYNNGGIIKDKAPSMTTSAWEHNNKVVQIGNVGSNAQAQRVFSVRGKSITLNANGGGQGGKTGLYKIDLPDGEYIIRKLTPRECERLQTLSDDYTLNGMDEDNNYVVISNTQRYKQCGNGWTVDVIAYILSFLKEANNGFSTRVS